MEAVLVIAYLLGGQIIDKEVLEASNIQECERTKHVALTGTTPVTTRYGDNVKIKAECRKVERSAEIRSGNSIF